MPEGDFKPGISLAGAVDLEALKHQVKAEPGQQGGAPAAGGYVIDVTQQNFQAVAQSSATYPIVVFMWVPTDNRLFDMAQKLGDVINGMDGKLQLARIDVASEPEIAQAFGVQGAPALFALIGGRPMPILQGMPSDEEMTQITEQVLPQLVQVAAQAGVTGTANPDDLDAQLAVADVDMIGGQIQDAFDRLLDFLASHPDQLEPVRQRMLEYFLIPEPNDERLMRARRRLATLMY